MLAEGEDEANPFIYIPKDVTGLDKGVYIREDHFDYLPNDEFNVLMQQLAPFQPEVHQGMSERYFLHDRASRKANREKRKQDRATKKEMKNQKKDAKNALIRARAAAKSEGRGGNVLGAVVDGLKSVLGKTDSSDTGSDTDSGNPPPSNNNSGGGGGGGTTTDTKPFYTNPYVIGAGALGLAALAYSFSHKSN